MICLSSDLLAAVSFDWERFVSAVGAPGAILAALGWFLARAWREFAPLVKAWLRSQLENDQVHRQAVRTLAARHEELQLGHARTHRALIHTARAIEAGAPPAQHPHVQPHTAAARRELGE